MKLDRASILAWFAGKSLERAVVALDLLEQSIEQGYWVPKASRSVRAQLGKGLVAIKLGRQVEGTLRNMRAHAEMFGDGWAIASALVYGSLSGLLKVDLDRLNRQAIIDEQKRAVAAVTPFVEAMMPVAKAMAELDATRPIPVFTSIGVSPTISKTLQDARLELDLKTVRVCPVRYYRVEGIDPDTGETCWEYHVELLWPDNTVFRASRFANRGAFHNCEACGHSIRNPFNWVPILIDDAQGIPHALWVGRDCSGSVFGVKVTGELKYKDGPT